MEAQGKASSPDQTKDSQKLLKPSSSGELYKEPTHHPKWEEEGVIPGHTPNLLHVIDRRQPLSSVSSLEVHFDQLDLTELTDMSDQELTEVFADSDDENPNSPPSHHHHLPFHKGGYLCSPSWTRCSRVEQSHERKHPSESDSVESHHKPEHPKQP